jgi:2-polyprenyl-3-methyl-5-hydroxy-6-metoxy-1,4-benzoquinol methylase
VTQIINHGASTLSAAVLRPELQFKLEDIQDIAAWFQMSEHDVERRLREYERSEMAEAWKRINPQTPDEIRAFYAQTELYVWELIQWHAESGYERYSCAMDRLMQLCPAPARVLDYGCGIGDTALYFSKAGYDVIIADVPGKTLDFALSRFARRGLPVEVVEVRSETPPLPRNLDVLICFDVLEHIPTPDRLLFHLVDSLKPCGFAAIEASFFTDENYPHHLPHNVFRWAETGTWWIAMNAAGLNKWMRCYVGK